MRIAFMVEVESSFGEMVRERTQHFLLIPAQMASASDESDSREFSQAAEIAKTRAIKEASGESNGDKHLRLRHRAEILHFQILT
jgi:hypothetical protein